MLASPTKPAVKQIPPSEESDIIEAATDLLSFKATSADEESLLREAKFITETLLHMEKEISENESVLSDKMRRSLMGNLSLPSMDSTLGDGISSWSIQDKDQAKSSSRRINIDANNTVFDNVAFENISDHVVDHSPIPVDVGGSIDFIPEKSVEVPNNEPLSESVTTEKSLQLNVIDQESLSNDLLQTATSEIRESNPRHPNSEKPTGDLDYEFISANEINTTDEDSKDDDEVPMVDIDDAGYEDDVDEAGGLNANDNDLLNGSEKTLVDEIVTSLVTSGLSPRMVGLMNMAFYGLFIVLGLLLAMTWSVHVLLLLIISTCLFMSVSWFLNELKMNDKKNE